MAADIKYPDTANVSAASRILHERLGDDAHLGPPDQLTRPADDGSTAVRLLCRWFSGAPADRSRDAGPG